MLSHVKCDEIRDTAYFFALFTISWYFFPSAYVMWLHIWYSDTNGVLGQRNGDVLAYIFF